VREAVRETGADVRVDDAGRAVGGNSGNVIARLPATGSSAAPLLLCAHMDTVTPGAGVKPTREDGRIRSDGTTILGGDDKSGVAVIVEVLRVLAEQRPPHGEIEAVFTICEEAGLLGAKHIDVSSLRAREALVLDAPTPRELVVKAPAADRFEFVVHGLESHAGMAPEAGISAVRVAAEAIAAMPLGRVDEITTSNVVIAEGSGPINVVPNRCVIQGEARSHDVARLEAAMSAIRRAVQDAASRHVVTVRGKTVRAWIEERCEREYDAMNVPVDAPIVKLLSDAARDLGRPLHTVTIGGGSDANVFNARGIPAPILGTGMREIHTVNEWLDLEDFYACAELVMRAVTLRAGKGAGQLEGRVPASERASA
jgi:tripeptide aminopeptidase